MTDVFWEESDQDEYTVTKRRKTNEDGEFVKSSCESSTCSLGRPRKSRETPILQMPTEVQMQIFKYISFKELGASVRSVCKKFLYLINDMLTKEFSFIGRKIKIAYKKEFKTLHSSKPMSDNAARKSCKMLKIMEICSHQHHLLRTTMWRYINEDYHIYGYKYCFYGGKILDLLNTILINIHTNPTRLFYQSKHKEHKLPKVIHELQASVKKFIIFFERTIEPEIPNLNDVYGAKMVDILDDAKFADKVVIKENIENERLDYEVVYVLKNAWFTALGICKSPEEVDWREEQRLMGMRLRRITSVHTDMVMEVTQWNREVSTRTRIKHVIKPPISSQYSGYGDYDDKFFFYGVMNEGAYIHKFINNPDNVPQEPRDQADDQEDVENLDETNGPNIELKVFVVLRCHLSRAPRKIFKAWQKCLGSKSNYSVSEKTKHRFDLALYIKCPSANASRLPSQFSYMVEENFQEEESEDNCKTRFKIMG